MQCFGRFSISLFYTLNHATFSKPLLLDRPDAPICQEFILDKCKNGSKCTGHHCSLPYQWQYVDGQEWNSLKEQDNEKLEQMYCDVNLEEFSPKVFRRSYFGKYVLLLK